MRSRASARRTACGYRQSCFWLCPVLSFVPVATCWAFEAGFRTSPVLTQRCNHRRELRDIPWLSASTTVYLSVFKWEKRKGWDVLLQAFFAEFGEDDDVLLLLRSKPPGGALAEFKAMNAGA